VIVCGAQVKVTTVDGPVELKIPAGTQPGTTLLMAKRGVPRLGSNPQVRGNHNVSLGVDWGSQDLGGEAVVVTVEAQLHLHLESTGASTVQLTRLGPWLDVAVSLIVGGVASRAVVSSHVCARLVLKRVRLACSH
jgi:hypothetical protein